MALRRQCFLFFLCVVAPAQVVISAVTDGASFGPRVAPGSLATIFGTNLAGSAAHAPGFPLPTSLNGTTVYVNGSPVPLAYVGPSQVNFQVPRALAAGVAQLSVKYGSGQSNNFGFLVMSAAPGIFQDSSNHAAAQDATYHAITAKNPAIAGDTVIVYLTGQGAVKNPVADGAAAPVSPLATATATATATVGGAAATVEFLGLSPGFAGLAQANIQVPKTLATGSYPVVVTVGGIVGASAQMAVSGAATGAPPSVLKLVGQVGFLNSTTSQVATLNNVAYVCGANRIAVIDLTTATAPKYLGEFGDVQLNASGGPCALNLNANNTAEPFLADITGPGATPSYIVWDLASPLAPALIAQVQSLQYTNIANLSFLGMEGVSSTNWFTFNNAGFITGQFGDLIVYDFSSPSFPNLIGVLQPTGTATATSTLKPNALVVAQSPPTAYVTTTTATGSNTTTGSGALFVVDLTTPSAPTLVSQLIDSNSAIFTGFAFQYGYSGLENLLLIMGNTANHRNPGIVDAATGLPDFSLTGTLTLNTVDITNIQNPQSIATLVTTYSTSGALYGQGLGGSFFAIVDSPPATDPTGPATLLLVDARTPTKPVVYPLLTQYGLSGILSVDANSYLLVPTASGLNVYSITIP